MLRKIKATHKRLKKETVFELHGTHPDKPDAEVLQHFSASNPQYTGASMVHDETTRPKDYEEEENETSADGAAPVASTPTPTPPTPTLSEGAVEGTDAPAVDAPADAPVETAPAADKPSTTAAPAPAQ